ncbi:hypothetical protein [Halobellus salinus]|uniref:hypothetical protein n=1 Tax=Halobellus salinus TaxID=931585 RepID=UPI0016676F36|nr:hypothetical protein [Halobellus salinus]
MAAEPERIVDIDSETLFNTAVAVLTTVAVLVFVFNVDLGHSPVTEFAVVVAFLSGSSRSPSAPTTASRPSSATASSWSR